MDYMKLKLAIYESYGNGEMTSEACSHLIDHLDEKYGESIVEEAATAENNFINASLKVFTESAGEEALTEAAKDFGAKIKAAWEKFKAWIKKIIEKILNLGKEPEQQKAEIKVPNKLDKALSDAKKWIAKLGGAKTVGAIGVAIGGIVASTATIIQNRKLKETMGTKTYEYEKFKKEQADLVKEMQDAALKAQERFETLKSMNNRNRDIANGFANDNDALKIKLDGAERRLAAAQAKAKEDMDRLNKVNDNQKQTIGEQQIKIGDQKDEIEKLKKEVEDLKKQIADSKKKEASAPKKSDDAPGETVTDSKILSASTGFVNAVTQTVVALLPKYSSKTTDEIDGKVSTYISRGGYIRLNDNTDMRVLMDAKTNGRRSVGYIKDFIKTKLMADDFVISDYLNKLKDCETEVYRSVDMIESTFENKLKSKYNFETIDGIKSFANDYSSGSGEVGSMIKDAVKEAEKVSSIGDKYKSMGNHVTYTKDKADAAVKDYHDVYKAHQITRMTYDIIRRMAADLKKRLHNVKEPTDY